MWHAFLILKTCDSNIRNFLCNVVFLIIFYITLTQAPGWQNTQHISYDFFKLSTPCILAVNHFFYSNYIHIIC